MNVSLSPVSPRTSAIGLADDPYKKHWFLVLGGIGLIIFWLSLPILMSDKAVGSTSVSVNRAESQDSAERGLQAADGSAGAPGAALDASLDASGRKSSGLATPESMLYQPPADASAGAAAAGAPLSASARAAAGAGAGAGTLAQALKNAGKPKDAAGWGEKAQRGFESPHLSGSSLGGLGSASGGHSSASASVFGTHGAAVGSEAAHGLADGGAGAAGPGRGAGVQGLKQIASASSRAVSQRNADGAAGNMSKLFDGSKGDGSTPDGAGGKSAYDSLLDAAPSNLKTADAPSPNAAPPPGTTVQIPPNMGMQILTTVAGMAIGAMVGGAVGGMAGQMIASAASSAVSQMAQQQQQQYQQQQCQQLMARYPTVHCS